MMPFTALLRAATVATLTLGLMACSGGGALSPGLSANMDVPGAQLNRPEALGIVNHYRSSIGIGPLTDDPALDATAQTYAANYAHTGHQTPKPQGTIEVRYSAGSENFAETFSTWRSAPEKSAALSDGSATRAGLAVVYDPNSPYGTYWVMIVG